MTPLHLASLLLHSIAVAAPALLLATEARAYSYSLVAEAGGDSSATSDTGVSSVEAEYRNPEEISEQYEFYRASASDSGTLSASASSEGYPPFAPISHHAVARIEETIRLLPPPFPTGPVTVTVGLGATLSATAQGGGADAIAGVQIEPFSETCTASRSFSSGASGSCPAGTVDDLQLTRTFTLQELSNRGWEIDIAGQVETTLDLSLQSGAAIATASGGLYANVSGGDVGDWSWSGESTQIPVPEPGATALGLAALAATSGVASRRARRSAERARQLRSLL